MVAAKDLWVGDWLRVIATGQKGRFESQQADDTIVLRLTDDALHTFNSNEVELLEEETEPEALYDDLDDLHTSEGEIQTVRFDAGVDVLDLHYQELKNKFPHDHGSILEYQILCCATFIDHVIGQRRSQVSIIHGIGQGVLKKEVENLIKLYPQVTLVSSNPNQASLDVWFNF